MAYWVDDAPGHEQTGMQWRDVPELQLNKVWVQHYIDNGDADQPNRIWWDDIVISTERIGCAGSSPANNGSATNNGTPDNNGTTANNGNEPVEPVPNNGTNAGNDAGSDSTPDPDDSKANATSPALPSGASSCRARRSATFAAIASRLCPASNS